MDQITKKTSNPKGRIFLKIDLERDLAKVFILGPLPSYVFVRGGKAILWVWNLVKYTAYAFHTT
jgi:hypothetical protein